MSNRRILCKSYGGVPLVYSVVIHTTSTLASWIPNGVTNGGDVLSWEVTGDATGSYSGNVPTIDLSGNTGTAIITITSTDDIAFFTSLTLDNRGVTEIYYNNTSLVYTSMATSLLSVIEFVGCDDLEIFSWGGGTVPAIDLTECPNIGRFNLITGNIAALTSVNFGTSDFSTTNKSINVNGTIPAVDISNATELDSLNLSNNVLTSINISANTLLTTCKLRNNNLDLTSVNNVIIQLDANGLTNGTLWYDGSSNANPTVTQTTTNDVLNAYNNLITKGWSIVGSVPS